MTDVLQRIVQSLPAMRRWIDELQERHDASARPVAELGYSHLPAYFSAEILGAARIAIVPDLPSPPVLDFNLLEFLPLVTMALAGITFGDTFFVRESDISEELCFHELIHVVQWGAMGVDAFLLTYGAGVLRFGYERSPLEAIAYAAQSQFAAGAPIPSLVSGIVRHAASTRAEAAALYARAGIATDL